MAIEQEILEIIKPIWYSKKNLNELIENKDILLRGKKIQEPLHKMYSYKSKKQFNIKGMILDNYFGSLQHYLIGFELSSIHLSSKAMEMAILYKIANNPSLERKKSYSGIVGEVVKKGLLTSTNAIISSQNVVDRRNFFVHDAIFQQALHKTTFNWFKTQLDPNTFDIYRRIFRQFDDLSALPDLDWYVTENSLQSSQRLIITYLEDKRDHSIVYRNNNERDMLQTIIQTVKNVLEYEFDFIRYSASLNINDVYLVLKELYGDDLFIFK